MANADSANSNIVPFPSRPDVPTGPSHDPLDAWHYTPAGDLLPRTHPWRRLTIDRQHSTKRLTAIRLEIEAATDAIGAALEAGDHAALDPLLTRWRDAATAFIIEPLGSRYLRSKVAFFTVCAGHRFERMHVDFESPTSTEGMATAMDQLVFSAQWADRYPPRKYPKAHPSYLERGAR